MRRAQRFARRFPYVLTCDIQAYFPSIDHAILKAQLRRQLKDKRLLALLDHIIGHPLPNALPGKGLPIGSLTSQYFANLYLGELDRFLKDRLRVKGYVRYMDDVLGFAADKVVLHELHAALLRVQRNRWVQFRRKVRKREWQYAQGVIDEAELAQCVASMIGHVVHADTLAARRHVFGASLALG